MLVSAVAHFLTTEAYAPLIPEFIPLLAANWTAGLAEGAIGLALLRKQWRSVGGYGFALLMLAFLPLHIWDLLRVEPFLGSTWAAALRLAFQLFLIFIGWQLGRSSAQADEG